MLFASAQATVHENYPSSDEKIAMVFTWRASPAQVMSIPTNADTTRQPQSVPVCKGMLLALSRRAKMAAFVCAWLAVFEYKILDPRDAKATR